MKGPMVLFDDVLKGGNVGTGLLVGVGALIGDIVAEASQEVGGTTSARRQAERGASRVT